jgi:hypothetical protein
MDTRRFDALTRTLTTSDSPRRTFLQVLGASALAAVVGRFAGEDAEARKKRKRKRKKKKTASAPPACAPNCGPKICGDDGCGGSCGACPGGRVCLSNGSCATVCDELADCADGCSCSGANTEGIKTCAAPGFSCEAFVQVCTGTAGCPPGQTCQGTGCGAGGSVENRCVPRCSV